MTLKPLQRTVAAFAGLLLASSVLAQTAPASKPAPAAKAAPAKKARVPLLIEQRAIEVSRTEGANWVVESGLAAGDRVVVEGLQKARPGMVVTAVERSAAAAAPESAPHAAALH